MSKTRLPVEQLQELFTLDHITGHLYWKARANLRQPSWNTRFAGKLAGSLHPTDGYLRVGIGKRFCQVHIIVWAMCNGRWPDDELDHRNGVRDDNRPVNLREATRGEQSQNLAKRADNTSGYTGVSRAGKKWSAEIWLSGEHHRLGYFDTPEDAYAGYCEAKSKLHEFNPTVREV